MTLVRLAVTKRRLLEWETAATTAARTSGLNGRRQLVTFVREMASSPIIAGAAALLIAATRTHALPAAAPFLLLWLGAPLVAYWLSVPIGPRVRPLTERDRAMLRRTARKTWRYFETFVTQADCWLPPDNYQDDPAGPKLARRTSPTNIGMALLSTLAAHDLGYLTTDGLVQRLDATLTTLEGLERYDGHFLNWYDTATLTPLHPRYVSTVDSGNMAAALIALAQGLRGLAVQHQTQGQLIRGLVDTSDVLALVSAAAAAGGPDREAAARINQLAREIVLEARKPTARTETAPFDRLAGQLVEASAALPETAEGEADIVFWSRAVVEGVRRLGATPSVTGETLQALARRAAMLAETINFAFLSRPAPAHLLDRLPPGGLPRVRDGSTARSTTCWPRKRGSPASSPSPRATCRSITGSTSDGWSPTSTVARRWCRGAARCSST